MKWLVVVLRGAVRCRANLLHSLTLAGASDFLSLCAFIWL
jgi:hypothetical protein